MIAVGFIYGISFFYPEITPMIAKYIITGAPTLIMLTVGLVVVPQVVANMRTEGTFDYVWSLPVPRMTHIDADATNTFGTTLPGVIVSVILGAIYFDFDLNVSLLVIPGGGIDRHLRHISSAILIAFAVPKPMMVNVITQILVFFVMMFSPVMFPAEQLPGWLQAVHKVLPIQYMADLIRGTLTDLPVNLGLSFGVVGAWCAGSFILTYLLVRRRK